MRKRRELALRASALSAAAALTMVSGTSHALSWSRPDAPLARLPLSAGTLSIFERGDAFGERSADPGIDRARHGHRRGELVRHFGFLRLRRPRFLRAGGQQGNAYQG